MPADMSSEIELLKASLRGDTAAFEAVVRKYQDLVCAITFSGTTDRNRSEELAQETFLSAWKNLAQLRELNKFRPWLCTIARNAVKNARLRQQRDVVSRAVSLDYAGDVDAGESDPADQAITSEQQAVVEQALREIPEQYREPLVLFYRQGQSIKEVAAALELSESVTRQRLSRGRKLLRARVAGMVERTIRRTAPGKAFTTAVMAGVAVTAMDAASGVAVTAAAGSAAATGTAAVTAGAGLAVKVAIIAAAAILGTAAFTVYKHATAANETPQASSPAVMTVEQSPPPQSAAIQPASPPQENSAASAAGQSPVPAAAVAEDAGSRQPAVPVNPAQQTAAAPEPVTAVAEPNAPITTVSAGQAAVPAGPGLGIYVFDAETRKPLANTALRINRGCGCKCKPDEVSTDPNGFYRIDFKESKPSYLGVSVTKAGYVPMRMSWDKDTIDDLVYSRSPNIGTMTSDVVQNKNVRPVPSGADTVMTGVKTGVMTVSGTVNVSSGKDTIQDLPNTFCFYLDRGTTIAGVVQNEDGQPVASATIVLNMYVEDTSERPEPKINIRDYTVTTDSIGRWRCDVFPKEPRQFSVMLKHPDYGNTMISVNDFEYKVKDFYAQQAVLVIRKGFFPVRLGDGCR